MKKSNVSPEALVNESTRLNASIEKKRKDASSEGKEQLKHPSSSQQLLKQLRRQARQAAKYKKDPWPFGKIGY